MGAMSSQITSFTIVYSTVYSGADQRKHQSSASLPLCVCVCWGGGGGGGGDSPVNSPHKEPVTRKYFHLMTSSFANIAYRIDVNFYHSLMSIRFISTNVIDAAQRLYKLC